MGRLCRPHTKRLGTFDANVLVFPKIMTIIISSFNDFYLFIYFFNIPGLTRKFDIKIF